MADKTQLEILAEQYRKEVVSKNYYTSNQIYNSNNPNALSDGDEKGKGENDGKIGSSIDIQNRIGNLAKNTYNENNIYDSNNPNALSTGDDKG